MTHRNYTVEELRRLLESPEISDDFRKRIVDAIENGSPEAIGRLGSLHATAINQQEAVPSSEPTHE